MNRMPCSVTDDGREYEPPSALEDGEQISREQRAERFELSLSDAEWEERLIDALAEGLYTRPPLHPVVSSTAADLHYQWSMDAWRKRVALLANLRHAYRCGNHAEVGRIVSRIVGEYVDRVAEERS